MGKERENLVDSIFSVGKVNRVQMLCEKNTIDQIFPFLSCDVYPGFFHFYIRAKMGKSKRENFSKMPQTKLFNFDIQ